MTIRIFPAFFCAHHKSHLFHWFIDKYAIFKPFWLKNLGLYRMVSGNFQSARRKIFGLLSLFSVFYNLFIIFIRLRF